MNVRVGLDGKKGHEMVLGDDLGTDRSTEGEVRVLTRIIPVMR